MSNLCFFVHPLAGSGRAEKRLRAILQSIRKGHPQTSLRSVQSLEHAVSELRHLQGDATVVAVGGDGMVNLMVRALREAGAGQRPMGLLPLGTGNAFAHSLGLENVEDALETLRSSDIQAVDTFGTSHPKAPVVVCTLSLGYEARIIRGVAAGSSRTRLLLGLGAAAGSACHRESGVEASIDGHTVLDAEEQFFNFGFYNIPCYAFGRRVHPDTDPGDGSGSAVLHRRAASYWKNFINLLPEHRNHTSTLFYSGQVTTDRPIQVDGEFVGGNSFEIWVEPGSLNVLVPPSSR